MYQKNFRWSKEECIANILSSYLLMFHSCLIYSDCKTKAFRRKCTLSLEVFTVLREELVRTAFPRDFQAGLRQTAFQTLAAHYCLAWVESKKLSKNPVWRLKGTPP